jgi:hypothetical protein
MADFGLSFATANPSAAFVDTLDPMNAARKFVVALDRQSGEYQWEESATSQLTDALLAGAPLAYGKPVAAFQSIGVNAAQTVVYAYGVYRTDTLAKKANALSGSRVSSPSRTVTAGRSIAPFAGPVGPPITKPCSPRTGITGSG